MIYFYYRDFGIPIKLNYGGCYEEGRNHVDGEAEESP